MSNKTIMENLGNDVCKVHKILTPISLHQNQRPHIFKNRLHETHKTLFQLYFLCKKTQYISILQNSSNMYNECMCQRTIFISKHRRQQCYLSIIILQFKRSFWYFFKKILFKALCFPFFLRGGCFFLFLEPILEHHY